METKRVPNVGTLFNGNNTKKSLKTIKAHNRMQVANNGNDTEPKLYRFTR